MKGPEITITNGDMFQPYAIVINREDSKWAKIEMHLPDGAPIFMANGQAAAFLLRQMFTAAINALVAAERDPSGVESTAIELAVPPSLQEQTGAEPAA